MENLPAECLDLILQNLNAFELTQYRSVCKTWNDVIMSSEMIARKKGIYKPEKRSLAHEIWKNGYKIIYRGARWWIDMGNDTYRCLYNWLFRKNETMCFNIDAPNVSKRLIVTNLFDGMMLYNISEFIYVVYTSLYTLTSDIYFTGSYGLYHYLSYTQLKTPSWSNNDVDMCVIFKNFDDQTQFILQMIDLKYTVTSFQCDSYVIIRITNPEDDKHVDVFIMKSLDDMKQCVAHFDLSIVRFWVRVDTPIITVICPNLQTIDDIAMSAFTVGQTPESMNEHTQQRIEKYRNRGFYFKGKDETTCMRNYPKKVDPENTLEHQFKRRRLHE